VIAVSLRRAAAPALMVLFALAPPMRADDAEDAWKALVMKAIYAAGANDFLKAEQIFHKALHEAERLGPDDPRVGTTLSSLGIVYRSEKKLAEALSVFERAGGILDKAYGPESIDVADVNLNIASVLLDQGRHPAAIPYLKKCLTTYTSQLGGESLKTASVLCMTGESYRAQKADPEAEAPLRQCARIREADGGLINAPVGEALNSLALVYRQEGKNSLADQEFRLTGKIRERALGTMSPALADTLEAHASLLKTMGRNPEAQNDSTLAAAIRRDEHRNK
jgi:tetratricopeptide (TPR) repeat protein